MSRRGLCRLYHGERLGVLYLSLSLFLFLLVLFLQIFLSFLFYQNSTPLRRVYKDVKLDNVVEKRRRCHPNHAPLLILRARP